MNEVPHFIKSTWKSGKIVVVVVVVVAVVVVVVLCCFSVAVAVAVVVIVIVVVVKDLAMFSNSLPFYVYSFPSNSSTILDKRKYCKALLLFA